MKCPKKAQVTMFIILGLVILLLGGFFYFFFSQQQAQPLADEILETQQQVPSWAKPVDAYVEQCLSQLAEDAFRQLGQHGGYIDMQDTELSGRRFTLNLLEPTESDAFSLSTVTEQPIAYWWYLATENDCKQCEMGSLTPSLENIQGQVNRYINRELPGCLDDFEPLTEQNFDVAKKEHNTTTIVAENNIVVKLEMPLTVSQRDSSVSLEKFFTTLDLNFRQMYFTALALSLDEINNQRYETIYSDLISVYSGTDFNKLPPIAAVDHRPSIVTWQTSTVERNIKEMMMNNVNLIKVNNTKNAVLPTGIDAVEQGVYNRLFLDIFPFRLSEIEITYRYLNWPIYFDITPSVGGMLMPSVTKQDFPLGIVPTQQTNYYEFFYDISMPLMIQLKDHDAFNKQGYTFLFGLEINVRNNKNLLEWHLGNGTLNAWDYDDVTVSINHPDVQVDTTSIKAAKSLFCDPAQLITPNVTLQAKDGAMELGNASLSYGCGRYQNCYIGSTQQHSDGIYFEGKLPFCQGGYLTVERTGYAPAYVPYTPGLVREETKAVNLQQFKYYDADVKIQWILDPHQASLDNLQHIQSSETVELTITKIPDSDNPFDKGFTQIVSVAGNVSIDQEVKLIPGTYAIRALYTDAEPYLIEKNCLRFCTDVDDDGDCEDWDFEPETDIAMSSIATMVLDETTGLWEVTAQQLSGNSDTVTFFIYRPPKATCIGKSNGKYVKCEVSPCRTIDDVNKFDDYNVRFRNDLEPEFS